MLILLACAKNMSSKIREITVQDKTNPAFEKDAIQIALWMSQFKMEELQQKMHINRKIALENYIRFQNFHADKNTTLQAIFSYTGIAYKRLNPEDFSTKDFLFAQDHLRIASFLYGLLRPLDAIRPYRLEGYVHIPETNKNIFEYWRPRLTDVFLKDIKK